MRLPNKSKNLDKNEPEGAIFLDRLRPRKRLDVLKLPGVDALLKATDPCHRNRYGCGDELRRFYFIVATSIVKRMIYFNHYEQTIEQQPTSIWDMASKYHSLALGYTPEPGHYIKG